MLYLYTFYSKRSHNSIEQNKVKELKEECDEVCSFELYKNSSLIILNWYRYSSQRKNDFMASIGVHNYMLYYIL